MPGEPGIEGPPGLPGNLMKYYQKIYIPLNFQYLLVIGMQGPLGEKGNIFFKSFHLKKVLNKFCNFSSITKR